jgi:hypothetical protein
MTIDEPPPGVARKIAGAVAARRKDVYFRIFRSGFSWALNAIFPSASSMQASAGKDRKAQTLLPSHTHTTGMSLKGPNPMQSLRKSIVRHGCFTL